MNACRVAVQQENVLARPKTTDNKGQVCINNIYEKILAWEDRRF